MNHLIKNFRNDKISVDELEKLKEETNRSTRKDLEYSIHKDWMEDDDLTDTSINNEIRSSILENIHSNIEMKRKFRLRAISICSAACVCIMAVMGYIYYNFENNIVDTPLNFTTAKNENATVLLPDSSIIKLNQNSDLTYMPAVFKKSNREIEFQGEGYFKIAHDANNPFTIKTGNLLITVRGTEFNLSSIPQSHTSSLYLIEGNVEMYSGLSRKIINVLPGQLIEYNTMTGEFNISTPRATNNISSWYSGEIRFDNESLPEVLTFLERHYDVKLEISYFPDNLNQNSLRNLYFNGTLPTKNLPLAIEALEKVYNIKIKMASVPNIRRERQ